MSYDLSVIQVKIVLALIKSKTLNSCKKGLFKLPCSTWNKLAVRIFSGYFDSI